MEEEQGKWRFTSPTHVVQALATALAELEQEGGVIARHGRYRENHRILVDGMRRLGFESLLDDAHQSPIVTVFRYPHHSRFDFQRFCGLLKTRGFVIYPGMVSGAHSFGIGNIGDVHPGDIERLLHVVGQSIFWL